MTSMTPSERVICRGCHLVSDISASGKHRNTLLADIPQATVIVDPQAAALPAITSWLSGRNIAKGALVVVSHEHGSHFDGLPVVLGSLAQAGVSVRLLCPCSVSEALRPQRAHVDRIWDASAPGPFVQTNADGSLQEASPENNDGSPALIVEAVRGHCSLALTLDLQFPERHVCFLSDNLTSCFPSPITPGGNLAEMVAFLRLRLHRDRQTDITYVPGHGNPVGRAHLSRLLDYYLSVQNRSSGDLPADLVAPGYWNTATTFHQLNLAQAEDGRQ